MSNNPNTYLESDIPFYAIVNGFSADVTRTDYKSLYNPNGHNAFSNDFNYLKTASVHYQNAVNLFESPRDLDGAQQEFKKFGYRIAINFKNGVADSQDVLNIAEHAVGMLYMTNQELLQVSPGENVINTTSLSQNKVEHRWLNDFQPPEIYQNILTGIVNDKADDMSLWFTRFYESLQNGLDSGQTQPEQVVEYIGDALTQFSNVHERLTQVRGLPASAPVAASNYTND